MRRVHTYQYGLLDVSADVQEAILLLDAQGRVLMADQAARDLLQLSEDDLGHSFEEVISHPELVAVLCNIMGYPAVSSQASEIKVGDRHYQVVLSPTPENSDLGRWLVLLHDITTLKRLDELRSQAVREMAHDIRSHLGVIQGYLELLPQQGPLSQVQEEIVQRALESVERVVTFITHVLDLERIRAGLLEIAPCDPYTAFADALEALGPLAERKGIALHVDLPSDLPDIEADATRLAQLVNNLVTNAIKHSPRGTQVWVRSRVEDDMLLLEVQDSGPGIPPEIQQHMFEPYYARARHLTSGFGLGLSIVKSIVDAHHGRIEVDTGPEKGTTFRIYLPLHGPGS